MNAKMNLAKIVAPSSATKAVRKESTEFIVFNLGEQKYGIDLRHVQRLRGYRSLTRIANGPDFVEGVAISDGIIMPIIDMRPHFNILPSFNHFTVAIILGLRERTVGLVVDSVLDVVSLPADEIKLLSAPKSSFAGKYLTGIACYEGRDLILLDIQKLMGSSDIGETEKMKA
jgi:purine-binding chemotaxis protein CheW